jgi:hypothetical protein
MATRRANTPRRTPKRAARRPAAMRALARMDELPPTLAHFTRRVTRDLAGLEKRLVRAESRTRREIARVLCDASRCLGRFEAEGERRWKRLTNEARREALSVLHRLEKMIERPARKSAPRRRKTARRKARPAAAGAAAPAASA